MRCSPTAYAHLVADQAAGRSGGTTVVVNGKGEALYFSKRVLPHILSGSPMEADPPVLMHLGLYAYRRPALALKFDSGRVDGMAAPRPYREISVYSPRVEGVHLRFGAIARGGLRWSDRPEDFRTEILGLVKAQQVKNAVIVPVGAKGGFVPKRMPANPDRDTFMAEGTACYTIFIGALLDLTDNLDGDTVIIQESDSANTGEIVVALVDNQEATLKRLRRRGDSIALEAANPAYETRLYGADRVRVQGKLVGLIRRY